MEVEYSKNAITDFDEITLYTAENSADIETAIATLALLQLEIEALSERPLLGNRIKRLSKKYRYWLVLNSEYKVFYERLNDKAIRVVRIYPVKRELLSLEEQRRLLGFKE